MVFRIAGQGLRLVFRHAGGDQGVGLGADFLIETVTDALVEQQRDDLAAELGIGGIATQNIGRRVEIAFELALGHAPGGADDDGRGQDFQQLFQVHRVLLVDRLRGEAPQELLQQGARIIHGIVPGAVRPGHVHDQAIHECGLGEYRIESTACFG